MASTLKTKSRTVTTTLLFLCSTLLFQCSKGGNSSISSDAKKCTQRCGRILTQDAFNSADFKFSDLQLDLNDHQHELINNFIESIITESQPPTTSSSNFIYDWNDYRFQEVQAFYQISQMGKWADSILSEIGLKTMTPISVRFFDSPLFSNSMGCSSKTMELSLAGVAPIDRTVIAHEYGHAIHSQIVGCDKINDFDGLMITEGIGDCLAYAFTSDRANGRYRFFEFSNLYDKTWSFPSDLLNLKNYFDYYSSTSLEVWKHFPRGRNLFLEGLQRVVNKKGYILEPHISGRILASALILLSDKIGAIETTKLLLKGLTLNPNPLTFFDVYLSVKEADKQLFKEQHQSAIQLSFNSVGIKTSLPVILFDNDFDYNHTAFKDSLWKNSAEVVDNIDNDGNGYIDDLYGMDLETKTGDTTKVGDDCGHGTMVADTIAKSFDQIKLFGIRAGIKDFLSIFHQEQSETTYNSMKHAFTTVLNNTESRLFHYSGGMGLFDCVQTASSLFPDLTEEQISHKCHAVLAEWQRFWTSIVKAYPKTVFVFAAGNYSKDNDIEPTYPCSLDSPNVICVANIKREGDSFAFSNSNFGLQSVDVATIGENKHAACGRTKDGYGSIGKTSGAAAYISGLAANIMLQNPTLSSVEIVQLIIETSQESPLLYDHLKSHGIVDFQKASLAGRLTLPFGNNILKAIEQAELKQSMEFLK